MRKRRPSPPARAAAVAGGFTTVCCMPNTKPPLDNEGQIEFILRESRARGPGQRLSRRRHHQGPRGQGTGRDRARCTQRGAIAFTDDGVGVADASVMRKALQYANMFDAVLMQHCEEPTLGGGAMNAGLVATTLGLPGMPAEAEQLMIARDLLLNRTHRLPLSRAAHLQRRQRGAGPPGQARRAARDGRGHAASPAADRRVLPELRHQLQDEPAAAHRGRRAGGASRASRMAPSTAWPPITPRTWPRKRNWNSTAPPTASSAWSAPCRCTSRRWSSRGTSPG